MKNSILIPGTDQSNFNYCFFFRVPLSIKHLSIIFRERIKESKLEDRNVKTLNVSFDHPLEERELFLASNLFISNH
jgi:hypothetical protein